MVRYFYLPYVNILLEIRMCSVVEMCILKISSGKVNYKNFILATEFYTFSCIFMKRIDASQFPQLWFIYEIDIILGSGSNIT